MSEINKYRNIATDELFERLEALLEKLPSLIEDKFFECLKDIDEAYCELYSRELSYSDYGRLEASSEKKEEILTQTEHKIEKLIDENIEFISNLDIITEKEKYRQAREEWHKLNDYQHKLLRYRLEEVNLIKESIGKHSNPMETMYFLGVDEEMANTKIQMGKIIRNPEQYTEDEVEIAKKYVKAFWKQTLGDEDVKELKEKAEQLVKM